jgi:hypothetical protein
MIQRRVPPLPLSLLGALLASAVMGACGGSYGGSPPDGYVATSSAILVAPPDLPVYDQPPCPGDDFLWTPGYWAWDGAYYWVPGAWVEAPEPGFFWTPAWWGWGGTAFVFHEGYWGPHVGFYGGIAYGYGYTGHGYEGGRWDNGHFVYNQSVNNVNTTIVHNVYNTTVINNTNVTRVSYNGGNGGVTASATAEEEAAARDRHVAPVASQTELVRAAKADPQLRASVNQGKPPIAATPRAGALSQPGVVPAREGGALHAPPAGAVDEARSNTAVHPKELPAAGHGDAPNTGDPKLDQQYRQEQDKLTAQQNKERADLQAKQDQEHAQMAQQKADAAKTQQLEQRHQQQTQALAQRHSQQWQQLRARQAPRGGGHRGE